MLSPPEERRERILATICSIPPGKVSTYGAVAEAAGLPRGARQVAWALRTIPKGRVVPWFRVMGAGGRVVLPSGGGLERQVKLLRKDGVQVSDAGRVDLKRFAWTWSASGG